MSPQKEDMTTRQEQEPHTVEEDNLWTLGSPMTTSKMGSLSASIVTNMGIWKRNAEQRKGNGIHEPVSNATERGILPRIVKEKKR